MGNTRRRPGEAVLLAVAMPIAALVVGTLVGAQAAEAIGVGLDSFRGLVLATIGYQGVGVGVVAVGYYSWRGDPSEHLGLTVPDRTALRWAGGGFAGLVGLWYGVNVVATAAGVPLADHQLGALSDPAQIAIFVVLSFTVVAPGEELLYRGLVQGSLREAFGPWPSIAGASLLFALNHVSALVATGADGGTATAVTVGLILVLSVVLGALYERTGTIVVPVLVHGGFNGLQFGLRFLEVTGGL